MMRGQRVGASWRALLMREDSRAERELVVISGDWRSTLVHEKDIKSGKSEKAA
jgi:hypothetical protein